MYIKVGFTFGGVGLWAVGGYCFGDGAWLKFLAAFFMRSRIAGWFISSAWSMGRIPCEFQMRGSAPFSMRVSMEWVLFVSTA